MIYTFVFEGENIDGDILTSCVEFESADFKDACESAEVYASTSLEIEGGGHMDIYDVNGEFINDVEV